MRLLADPDTCRKAARAVQTVPGLQQWDFVMALGKANSINDLSPKYRDWLNNGYSESESAKVTKSLEEALADVKLEWIEE
jgi:hypothetical protein